MDENGSNQAEAESPDPKQAMVAKFKAFMGHLYRLFYIASLPLLFVGIWLVYMRDYDCEDLLRMHGLRVGIAVGMIILFILSNVAVFYSPRFLTPGIMVVMVPLMIMLTMGLAFSGAYRLESRAVPASPMWLRERVNDALNWNKVKACIYESRLCADLGFKTMGFTPFDFKYVKLSPMESGCCKPPSICRMKYVNATFWMSAKSDNGTGYSAPFVGGDCDMWSNNPATLCYDCQSCREGFIQMIHKRWRHLGIFLVVMSIFLIIIHLLRFILTLSATLGT